MNGDSQAAINARGGGIAKRTAQMVCRKIQLERSAPWLEQSIRSVKEKGVGCLPGDEGREGLPD
jgi:hypothetical protein